MGVPAPSTERLLSLAAAGDRAIPRHPYVPGNDVRLLVDTREVVPALLRDIAQARSQVNVAMFSWQDDGAGRVLGDALARKAREGVRVTLTVDGLGSRQWPFTRYRKYLDQLAAAGVQVRRSWPTPTLGAGALLGFEHRKLFEIDGRISWLGGMNLAKKYDEWHDLMVRVQGPVSVRAGAELLGRWRDLGGSVDAVRTRVLANAGATAAAAGKAAVRLLANSPHERDATDEFQRMAATAQKRLWVMTPFVGSEEMVRQLRDAAARGVDVRVVVPGPNMWKNGQFALPYTRSFYKDLMASGIKVFEQPQMSHGKAWLADDVANVGSVNVGARSANFDYEVAVSVSDRKFRRQVEQLFARDMARSHQVTAAEAESFRFPGVVQSVARTILRGFV